MNITREVINDLLPVYAAGEASADTIALVEEYLKQDSELNATVAKWKTYPLPAVAPEFRSREQTTLLRTQRLLSWRSTLLGVSLLLTFLPFSARFDNGHLTWLLFRDVPWAASVFWTVGIHTWLAYFLVWRRLRSTGL